MSDHTAEPSVYETPDVPITDETETAPPEYEYDSEYIVSDKIDPRASRNFFSEDATYARTKTIGQFGSSRLARYHETRSERIVRLHREIEELSLEDNAPAESDNLIISFKSVTDKDVVRVPGAPAAGPASQTPAHQPERLSLLESRVATLESRLGRASSANLASTIEILQTKIDIAVSTPEGAAQIKAKLQELAQCATTLDEDDMRLNVTELYQSLEKINNDSPTLALVIERLSTLQHVHEDASEVHSSYDFVKQSLNKRSNEIQAWQASLAKLESQVQASGEALRANTKVISDMRDGFLVGS